MGWDGIDVRRIRGKRKEGQRQKPLIVSYGRTDGRTDKMGHIYMQFIAPPRRPSPPPPHPPRQPLSPSATTEIDVQLACLPTAAAGGYLFTLAHLWRCEWTNFSEDHVRAGGERARGGEGCSCHVMSWDVCGCVGGGGLRN